MFLDSVTEVVVERLELSSEGIGKADVDMVKAGSRS